ncbi:MAG: GNAT family N-acetyltransferase [Nitrososphaerota archaeon]|nr:GNAT family N-acetyltransferase [Nitrososphaerota archaeon]MDG6938415.1 GNAT family N-acetyltransferase [Nitrososphaerota archaeon]MDG6957023.1 GNAT family N-acetyltransferase [Nitrososphaerota archaeon]MDG6957864.1 GNAT family N-acetyltransferase [Nitrososphaerota archaeon]MDG6959271.1 GNAT family N-acetyltransferase [Nitrososphaerota archaeon]
MEIRRARKDDVEALSDLIVRTKRLNNEFDPLFAVVPDAKARADKYIQSSLAAPGHLLLVAAEGKKVVGVLRAETRERIFYEPRNEGRITDFYILPEYRRKALGDDMIQQAAAELKKMGAEIMVADVPAQNEIANRFYVKRGFRALINQFAKRP